MKVREKRGWEGRVLDGHIGLEGDLSFSNLMMYLVRGGFGGFGIGVLDVMSVPYPSAILLITYVIK